MTYARAIRHGAIFLAKRLATNNITRHLFHAVLAPRTTSRSTWKIFYCRFLWNFSNNFSLFSRDKIVQYRLHEMSSERSFCISVFCRIFITIPLCVGMKKLRSMRKTAIVVDAILYVLIYQCLTPGASVCTLECSRWGQKSEVWRNELWLLYS